MKTPDVRGAVRSVDPRNGSNLDTLARAGFLTKAILYVTIGAVSVQAAFEGGGATGSKGVLQMIASQTFGKVLLGAMMIGLFAYAGYRAYEAIAHPRSNRSNDAEDVAKRVGFGASALSHLALGIWSASLLFGFGGGGGDSKQTWTAKLLGATGGQVLIGLIGAGIVAAGIFQLGKAYKKTFMDQLDESSMSGQEVKAARSVGIAGMSARGFVFGAMGWFLIKAAANSDASQVEGLGGVLRNIASSAYGPWLLALVSVGLLAYGVYCGFMARYATIKKA